MFAKFSRYYRGIVYVFVCASILVPAPGLLYDKASGHIVTERPWHPIAASYRMMMFLGDLKPVSWDKIQSAFGDPLPSAFGSNSAQSKLMELNEDLGSNSSVEILKAIDLQDRQLLFEAATRTISQSIRLHLKEASNQLVSPDKAIAHIEAARSIYRSIEDFIRQTDAQGFAKLGRAWLILSSSTGSRGILGRGKFASNPQRFDTARNIIGSYLKENYEPDQFTERRKLTPIPETIAASGQRVTVAPWLPPGSNLNDQNPLPLLVLNFEERGIDEKDLPLIAYGDMLFDSPEIFGEPAKSLGLTCSTCHNRSDINQSLFIPGISHQAGAIDVDGEYFNSLFNDRRSDSLDIPSLRGLRQTGPYGRDGRFGSLRDFTRNVIVNEFAGKEPTPFMLDALVSYMLEFDFLPNSKLTSDGRLTGTSTASAKRGEQLFRKPFTQMDGKSCATCHIPSANFLDRRAHNIGSGADGYKDSRAASFDTPTLLGSKFTAPYFHDGSLPTLASVVNWFDEKFLLSLTNEERKDLTAYLEAVGDADEPYEVYKGRHTPFRLAFEELTTFASTLDTLLPAKDAQHAKLLIDTVAVDLAADASGMANLMAKPKVYELANVLARVGKAIDQRDWMEAQDHWDAFKRLQDKYDEAMY